MPACYSLLHLRTHKYTLEGTHIRIQTHKQLQIMWQCACIFHPIDMQASAPTNTHTVKPTNTTTYSYTYTHTHPYSHTHTQTHTHTHTNTNIHTHTTHIHTHIRTHTYLHQFKYGHILVKHLKHSYNNYITRCNRVCVSTNADILCLAHYFCSNNYLFSVLMQCA